MTKIKENKENADKQQELLATSLSKISHSMKWVMISTVFTFVLGIVSYANDLFDLKTHINTTLLEEENINAITGVFSPSGTVPVNTKVTFKYSLPGTGYYTIWNQNREGVLKKLWPMDNKISSAISLGRNKQQVYPYPLLASTPHSNENMLVLWSDNANHPPKWVYPTWSEFQEYIDTHHYNWKKKAFSLQVE